MNHDISLPGAPTEHTLCECGTVIDEDGYDIYGKLHVCPLQWGMDNYQSGDEIPMDE